ncbi:MAG: lanthionine synthetase LanC family protein [Waddliaceae bacterium]
MSHPLFICQSMAEKLRDPKTVEELAEISTSQINRPSSLWQSPSFADGFAGISYFYSLMDRAFPGEGWGVAAQHYLLEALSSFKKNQSVNCSLFKGLSGISLAMESIQHRPDKFQQFHAGLDDWIIEEVNQSYLVETSKFLNEETLIPPFFYGFTPGLSGITAYLLSRKDNPYLQQLAKLCAEHLANMMLSKKRVGSLQVRAWYFTQDLLMDPYRSPDIEGGYNTSMFYGVTGCLMALSSAIIHGVCSDDIYKAVECIAFWIKDTYQYIFKDCYWNATVSVEGNVSALPPTYRELENSWLLGWPPVAKSLFLAGKAIKDETLLQFSKDLCSVFNLTSPSFFLGGFSFCLGISGFVSTLYSLSKEINNSSLLQTIRRLNEDCIRSFDPSSPFGFPQLSISEDEKTCWVESPSLASGSAGIGLSILIAEEKCGQPLFA